MVARFIAPFLAQLRLVATIHFPSTAGASDSAAMELRRSPCPRQGLPVGATAHPKPCWWLSRGGSTGMSDLFDRFANTASGTTQGCRATRCARSRRYGSGPFPEISSTARRHDPDDPERSPCLARRFGARMNTISFDVASASMLERPRCVCAFENTLCSLRTRHESIHAARTALHRQLDSQSAMRRPCRVSHSAASQTV